MPTKVRFILNKNLVLPKTSTIQNIAFIINPTKYHRNYFQHYLYTETNRTFHIKTDFNLSCKHTKDTLQLKKTKTAT